MPILWDTHTHTHTLLSVTSGSPFPSSEHLNLDSRFLAMFWQITRVWGDARIPSMGSYHRLTLHTSYRSVFCFLTHTYTSAHRAPSMLNSFLWLKNGEQRGYLHAALLLFSWIQFFEVFRLRMWLTMPDKCRSGTNEPLGIYQKAGTYTGEYSE